MHAEQKTDATKNQPAKNPTTSERTSDVDLVVTRTFDAPAHIVYAAWTTPALLMRWWAPKSFGITMISCDADVRAGGRYRFVFAVPQHKEPMPFFGRYLEVEPNKRIVWTNEEAGDAGAVTTVTLTEKDGKTTLVMHDRYPSKEALDEAIASGSTSGCAEQFEQLDVVVVAAPAAR